MITKNELIPLRSPSKYLCLIGFLMLALFARAQEFANIEYLCCDWGPAMKLPRTQGEKPQFSDTKEEVYFLKQVGRFTRGLTGKEEGKGINIYLCKMKADGSDKTEIRELWHDVRYPIDTQAQSTWMDVNEKTHKIALSVTYAGSDVMGLWTVNLDGSDLKQIIRTEWGQHLVGIDHPSWTPDGQWIVFTEIQRGTHPNQLRIRKCDSNGKRLSYLTDGPWQQQPAVSPDGSMVVYSQVGDAKTGGLYLMDIDGHDPHQLPNPDNRRKNHHSGIYPVWSPDGKRILVMGADGEVIDVDSGKVLLQRRPMREGQQWTYGWPHWGKTGIIGFTIDSILLTDTALKEAKRIGVSKQMECAKGKEGCVW